MLKKTAALNIHNPIKRFIEITIFEIKTTVTFHVYLKHILFKFSLNPLIYQDLIH